jgi:hypothetical protein
MNRVTALLTGIALSMSLLPSLPAQAANGQITCANLIRENGYSVVSSRGGENVYQNGRVVGYRYLYNVRNQRNRRGERYARGERNNIACVYNTRRDSARLIIR